MLLELVSIVVVGICLVVSAVVDDTAADVDESTSTSTLLGVTISTGVIVVLTVDSDTGLALGAVAFLTTASLLALVQRPDWKHVR